MGWLYGKPMNDMPFQHISSNGTIFTCPRCDLSVPVKVTLPDWKIGVLTIVQDVSEFVGYHSRNIWKELNGFQGYDCITYEFEEEIWIRLPNRKD